MTSFTLRFDRFSDLTCAHAGALAISQRWRSAITFNAVDKTLIDHSSMHLAKNHYPSKIRREHLPHPNPALIVIFPARQHLNLSLRAKISQPTPSNLQQRNPASMPSEHHASPPGYIPTYLDRILPLREMRRLLLLLLRHERRLMPAQPSPDRPRLLRAQIEREVLFLRVEEAELLPLVRVDDG